MERCNRCGGVLRQVAVLANYKSFVISLMRCEQCGATAELKENAHRLSDEPRDSGRARRVTRDRSDRRRTSRPARQPDRCADAHAEPEPVEPAPRRPRAKKLVRPFNVRVTPRKDRG
jgi:hypothetical protein